MPTLLLTTDALLPTRALLAAAQEVQGAEVAGVGQAPVLPPPACGPGRPRAAARLLLLPTPRALMGVFFAGEWFVEGAVRACVCFAAPAWPAVARLLWDVRRMCSSLFVLHRQIKSMLL